MARSLLLLAALALTTASSLAAHAAEVAPASTSAPLSVGEIVQRASAQLEHKPKKLVCIVDLKAAQLDSNGKPSETQESELSETWTDGVAVEGLPYQASLDGKPLTADELAKANEQESKKRDEMKEHEQKGEGGEVDPPLAAAQLPRHDFALLRRDTVDGRPVYVLSVSPRKKTADERAVTREGTIDVDAETFVPIRSSTHASPLPKHVDKMDFEEEFARTAQGETVPKRLEVTVSGGILFFTRTYRVETRWRDCK